MSLSRITLKPFSFNLGPGAVPRDKINDTCNLSEGLKLALDLVFKKYQIYLPWVLLGLVYTSP